MTIQQEAQQALDVQAAVNLSGVVGSFHRTCMVLWAEANRLNKGTAWVNQHPIVTLYLSKLASLNRTQCFCEANNVPQAYDMVQRLATGEEINYEPKE